MATRLISNVASELLPQNKQRVSWVVQNQDGTIECFIKKERPGLNTVSSTDHDYRLSAGGSIALSNLVDGPEAIQERWTIIASSGTPRIAVFETENINR